MRDTGQLALFILCEKEQRCHADLLNVQPDEDVLDRLWKEQSAGVARPRHFVHPGEEVLVQEEEQEERETGEAVDDG